MVAFAALILLGSPALAASAHQSTDLTLYLSGLLVNAGHQHYVVDGGQIVAGAINGVPVDSSDRLNFSLNAMVHGLSTSGVAALSLSGPGVEIRAQIPITNEVPAAVFPLDQSGASCNPVTETCSSQIPILFTGVAIVHLGGGQATRIPIGIESPYWSPFGGPILIASLESSTNPLVYLVATYDNATIDWTGVQLQGVVAGTFGTEAVSGFFAQTTMSHENLLTGTEKDSHTIAFNGMSDPVLNAKGTFSGLTAFTLAGSFDCADPGSPVFFPGLPEGTCTATGASSAGTFQMVGAQGAKIGGTYNTQWSVPSLFTSTIVLAAVVQH